MWPGTLPSLSFQVEGVLYRNKIRSLSLGAPLPQTIHVMALNDSDHYTSVFANHNWIPWLCKVNGYTYSPGPKLDEYFI